MTPLHSLCQVLGIQTSYVDDRHRLVNVETETLRRLITVLTGEEKYDSDVQKSLLKKLRSERFRRPIGFTHIAWNGTVHSLTLNYLQKKTFHQVRLVSEVDAFKPVIWTAKEIVPLSQSRFAEEALYSYGLKSDLKFDLGYHRIRLEIDHESYSILIIAAPMILPGHERKKRWGLFSPLYSIRSDSDTGIGGLNELSDLQRFVALKGGAFVGTLPLLAPFRTESSPFDPSPYNPSSRLFWNEIYLSVDDGNGEVDLLRRQTLVDYPRVYAHKRKYLEARAQHFFEHYASQDSVLKSFLQEKPEILAFARFQSSTPEGQNYELYVQYQFHCELTRNRDRVFRKEIAGLYLDFPIGVHAQGFDVTHYSNLFLKQASMGAPPDCFFDQGQNWGTIALSPLELADTQYDYFIRCIRNHVRYASLLRLDHVMGFNRLYLIPDGFSAKEGTYLKYPSDELYAILCLEAHLHQCELVGEDLGTVPPQVRNELDQHQMKRMWIFQLEFHTSPRQATSSIPKHSLTALNTHDLPPFAAFWETQESRHPESIRPWLESLGLPEKIESTTVFQKLSLKLAQSKSEIFMTNLEDLWGETEAQNVPGVQNEKIWRKKHRLTSAEWMNSAQIQQFLQELNEVRQ